MVERAAAQVYRPSPPLSPISFDSAIAEIAARQNELDGRGPPRRVPPRYAPPTRACTAMPQPAPAPHCPRVRISPRWNAICSRSRARSSRCSAPITSSSRSRPSAANSPKSATPSPKRCRAARSNSIENEIRSLSRRIDDTRQSGTDGQVLAGIERALAEIHEALRSLTPAEQLAGYDDAIRNLGAKLDLILRANDDPSTVHQLEGAIAALRSIVSNVASNDALARLSEDVQTLSSKVDQLARADGKGDSFAVLEAAHCRADLVAGKPRTRPAASDNSEYLESALRSLSERLDRMPVGNDNASAFAHLEQRVSYLLERLEASTDRAPAAAISAGSRKGCRTSCAISNASTPISSRSPTPAAAAAARRAMDSGIVDTVKRELSDIRFSQSETDRRTQDSLGDGSQHARPCGRSPRDDRRRSARGSRAPPVAARRWRRPLRRSMPPWSPARRRCRSRLARRCPYAAAARRSRNCRIPRRTQEHFRRRAARIPCRAAERRRPAADAAARDQRNPRAARRSPRAAIAPELPPDHPLEPGTRPAARMSSPSERIAASESAISEIAGRHRKSRSVRRASLPPPAAPRRPPPQLPPTRRRPRPPPRPRRRPAPRSTPRRARRPATRTPPPSPRKIRSLLVGASVVVIVLGTFKMAMTLLDTGSAPPMPDNASEPAAPRRAGARRITAPSLRCRRPPRPR